MAMVAGLDSEQGFSKVNPIVGKARKMKRYFFLRNDVEFKMNILFI